MKRYIIKQDGIIIGEANSQVEISRLIGCTRAHVSKQIQLNVSYIQFAKKQWDIVDKLAYHYDEERQYN